MTPGRRRVEFRTLDDIMPDVEKLLHGHTTLGAWSIGQICRHLATAFRRTADLPASTPRDPSRWVPEQQKQAMLETGVIPEGIPTSTAVPADDITDARAEADALRQAIAHYIASPGPAIAHPVLGVLTRAEWDRFHCVHSAHHLSFAIPNTPGP